MGGVRRRLRRLEDASGPRLRGEEPRNEVAEALFDFEIKRHLAGDSGLVYVDEEQAFYTGGGELAVSRNYANLEHILDSL